MGYLEEVDRKEIKELLSKGWITHDAMWFHHCLEEIGIERTNKINLAAVRSMSAIEVGRLKKALGIARERDIETFEELKDFIDKTHDLIIPRFMKFTYGFPGENVMHVGFDPGDCFAYQGIKMLGAIDGYRCGVLLRISCWFDGLGLDYTADPGGTDICMMHTKGRCFREYRFNFKN